MFYGIIEDRHRHRVKKAVEAEQSEPRVRKGPLIPVPLEKQ